MLALNNPQATKKHAYIPNYKGEPHDSNTMEKVSTPKQSIPKNVGF